MKRPKIGLTIAMLILTIILLVLVLFISFTTDKNNVLHLGDYYFTEYYDGVVVRQKGSAVMIKKESDPEVRDAVLVRTEDGLRILFVKALDYDTIYLNDINGDIAEAVSKKDDLIGEVEYYVPLLGYVISCVNSQNFIYLLLGCLALVIGLFGILVIKLIRIDKASQEAFPAKGTSESNGDEADSNDKDKIVEEIFRVFFNLDYTMSETKSLVKMILNAKPERLKVGVVGERKRIVTDAIKKYINDNDISNVILSETGVFSYIECEKEFIVPLCSIILNLKIKLSESERDTDA